IEISAYRQIDERRPRLSEVELRLLGYRDTSIRRLTEPVSEYTDRILSIDHRLLVERGRSHSPTRPLSSAPHIVRQVSCCITLDHIFCIRVLDFLLLKYPIIKSRNR